MTATEETKLEAIPQWQKDMDKIGFWRRLLLSRRWYGADWWFVALSGILLLFIFSMAFFPDFYAPYSPRAEVGPSLLAPGDVAPSFVLVGLQGGVKTVDDLAGIDTRVGIVKGSASSQVLREVTRARQAELVEAGQDVVLRPRPERYDTIEEALAGLEAGEVNAVVGLTSEVEPLLETYTELAIGVSLSGEIQKPFLLGTNQIGQDMFSRIIWGTQIALLVAFLPQYLRSWWVCHWD